MNVYRIHLRYNTGELDTLEAVADSVDAAIALVNRMCGLFYPISVERIA